jgi:hypothetical protein
MPRDFVFSRKIYSILIPDHTYMINEVCELYLTVSRVYSNYLFLKNIGAFLTGCAKSPRSGLLLGAPFRAGNHSWKIPFECSLLL